MALAEGKGSSYIGSICVLLPVMFVTCRSRTALSLALFLVNMIIITVMKTTILTIKTAARELMDAMYTVLAAVG